MQEDGIVRIFSGVQISGLRLKGILEQSEIEVIVKNEGNAANIAGFGGGNSGIIDLYIQEKDMEKAKHIIEDFSIDNE